MRNVCIARSHIHDKNGYFFHHGQNSWEGYNVVVAVISMTNSNQIMTVPLKTKNSHKK